MSTEDNLQIIQSADGLVADVRSMIADAREAVATWAMSGPMNETAHRSPTGCDFIPDEKIQLTLTTKAAS